MKKENKKKSLKTVIMVVIILLLLLVIVYLIFGRKRGFTITFDTDGGSPLSQIEVKDGEIVKLPENPTKEGYIFTYWVDEKDAIITNGSKISNDTELKASWIDEEKETITASFDTDGGNDIGNLLMEKGMKIKFPITPIKEGYVFAGWANDKGYIVQNGIILTEELKLKALWIKKGAKTQSITFNTDGGSDIENIIIEKGTIIRFPLNPTKMGFVFKGWVDENNKSITNDSIITENITIKALWVEPYTCPDGCTKSEDGSTCTKTLTASLTTGLGCPSGYTLKENQCLDLSTEYDRDAWLDNPDHNGTCLDDEGSYAFIFGMGASIMCAKKTDKITVSGCPGGYTKEGNTCKKVETINCTAN